MDRPRPWDPEYPQWMQSTGNSPGAPQDHLNGEWWHVDLVVHLNGSHTRYQDDPRGETLEYENRTLTLPRKGEPFGHTLAVPLPTAMLEHQAAHAAGQVHQEGGS